MKNQITLAQFGRNVRHFRLAAGLTQDDLAQKCKHLKNEIPQLEAGDINPTLSMVIAIAQALGVEPATLVDGVALAAAGDAQMRSAGWRPRLKSPGPDGSRAEVD